MQASPPSDAQLADAADAFGTPVYIYDLPKITAQVAQVRGAFPDADLFFAAKANPCGAVLQHLAALGLGAEVISEGELARTLRAGVPAERILLGGPRQDDGLVSAARRAGVGWVSLDNEYQAERWLTASGRQAGPERLLVRLNPALDPRTHEHLATGAATSKFGLPFGKTAALAERLGRRLEGFHVHIGSQIADVSVYDEVFRQLRALLERFPDVRTLDLGGGFAVPSFPLAAFADKVRAFTGQRLLLEPGRFLVADSGTLLTRVLHVKPGPVKHVVCDAGMADLLRPALYGARHPVRALGNDSKTTEIVDVDGPLCENADRLGQGVALPEVGPGDLLAVSEAGAYGYTMSSHYASSLRPAEAVWDGETFRLATRRERVEDLWRLECD